MQTISQEAFVVHYPSIFEVPKAFARFSVKVKLRGGFRSNKGSCGNLTDVYVALDCTRLAMLV